mmetsp:Transcript_36572/g.77058  ORF Transcript_36572/g.77058 Transcript_36572/m.77058 type:complete len:267 (-) Transcript_36572:368-1168(-)
MKARRERRGMEHRSGTNTITTRLFREESVLQRRRWALSMDQRARRRSRWQARGTSKGRVAAWRLLRARQGACATPRTGMTPPLRGRQAAAARPRQAEREAARFRARALARARAGHVARARAGRRRGSCCACAASRAPPRPNAARSPPSAALRPEARAPLADRARAARCRRRQRQRQRDRLQRARRAAARTTISARSTPACALTAASRCSGTAALGATRRGCSPRAAARASRSCSARRAPSSTRPTTRGCSASTRSAPCETADGCSR